MTLKTTKFDITKFLDSDEAIAEYLAAALETGDIPYINKAIGSVARARGMTDIARKSGLKREALYRALNENGNPQFSTIMSVLAAMGVTLSAKITAAE